MGNYCALIGKIHTNIMDIWDLSTMIDILDR